MTHSLDYWLFSVRMQPNLFYCNWYRMQRGYQTGRMGCTFLYCNEENDDKVHVVLYNLSHSSYTGWSMKRSQWVQINLAGLQIFFKLHYKKRQKFSSVTNLILELIIFTRNVRTTRPRRNNIDWVIVLQTLSILCWSLYENP